METEDVVEPVVDATEAPVETTDPARDEQGRFASGEKPDEQAPAEPQLDENGEPVVAAPPDATAEADQAVDSWQPFSVKLHGEERPLDWANFIDGETGGIYILPKDIPRFHQMAGFAEAYEKSRTDLAQQRRQVVELQRQLEARSKAPNEDVAAATVVMQRLQKLAALDSNEVTQFNQNPDIYLKMLVRDALDAGKDAKLKAYETARTETQSQWETEDTDTLQTDQLGAWIMHLRSTMPDLASLTQEQLEQFYEEVLPAKQAYFQKDGNDLKVRNDLLYKQLQARAKLLTEAQTRASAASSAKRQNEKVLNKTSAPPTVPAKGSAAPAEAKQKPKNRDEWRARMGIA